MLVIRLSRIGHENLQKFRIVVQEKTSSPKSGKVIAVVGNYDPTDPENKLNFDAEKIETFLKNGATPSDTIARLLLKNGFKKELVEKFVVKYAKQKPKKAAKEEEKPAAPAAAAEGEKAAPAEEQKEEKPAEEKKEEAAPAPAEEKPAEAPAETAEDKKE